MENNRLVKPITALATLGMLTAFPVLVSAYSPDTTHAALTQETLKFFNSYFKNSPIDKTDTLSIITGSIQEDDGLRMLQHFYDPVYNRGLTIAKEWQSSKEWAEDTLAQAGITERMTAGTLSSFFNGEDDYSWERGIYEYAWGDKQRGLEVLGHTLHLIQDASVPDHTRNDAHPPVLHFGSPYEAWTDKFDRNNIDTFKKIQNKSPIQLSSLSEYFDSIASYSNNNFFSRDTIFSEEYKNPNIAYEWEETLSDGEKYKFGYQIINGDTYRLIRIYDNDFLLKSRRPEYFVEDYDNLILADYWTLLSQQAVLHGAGVVKLFFDEVEKEKQTKVLYRKNKSWFQKIVDFTKKDIYQTATALYGGSVPYDDLIDSEVSVANGASTEQRGTTQQASAAAAQADASEGGDIDPPISSSENSGPTSTTEDSDGGAASSITAPPPPIIPTASVPTGDPSKPAPYQPGFGGGGGSVNNSTEQTQTSTAQTQTNTEQTQTATEQTQTESASASVSAPVILSPAANSFSSATSSVTVSGIASSTLVISNSYDSSTTTASSDESWSFSLTLPEGETSLKFTAANASGATSSPASLAVTVDTTAPTVSSFSVLECAYPLSSSLCLVASSTVNLLWSSSSDDISYVSLVRDTAVVSTTTGTSATLPLSGDGAYSIQVALYDEVGNGATSSAQSATVLTRPVVINEVSWAGTGASATDEWIELYNSSAYSIDLSRVSLKAEDGSPDLALSGTIASGAYYLIERTASTTTSVSEDLATAFSGAGGSGLSNDGEELSLLHLMGGGATTTIDATPAVSVCSGWCAGNTADKKSMERKSAASAGTAASNWSSNNTFTKNGTDANGTALNGTPKSQNSVSLLSIGYYCDPETASFAEGSYHAPGTSVTCTYLSSAITSGTRYGDIYRGSVASSTVVNGHSLGTSTSKIEVESYTGVAQGEAYFTAVYQIRSGPAYNDLSEFRSFFQSGSNSPPHLNYGVINWVYGTAP